MKTVIELLSDLIRIPSNSAVSNRPLVDYASDVLRASGWSTRELPYRDSAGMEKVNLIAAPPGQDAAQRDVDLVFMCHTDTVPYAADWPQALHPVLKNGNLHGCGSCDVKGFLACLLCVISSKASRKLPDGLRLVLTAEEEIGCIGAAHLKASDALRPRRIVIGEPTMLQPARAGKGYCLAEVAVHGKEAHSAHPQQGVSAIANAARLVNAIEEFATQLAAKTNSFFDPGFTTINIGTIQGGTAKNVVPGLCRFELEWRPIPGEPANSVLESVTAIIERLHRSDPVFHAEIKPVRQQPGFETAATASLVQSVEALSGNPATSIPFGSEASIFAPIADEVIVFGPGDMRTAHSSRECVPVAELDRAVACIATLMGVAE
ncbi:MAG TPA: acetylornithine deacetylase [Acidobacteriaceae bacterium]|jgi:acetylornithine deacetylase|nr:acetylornithine deacetylase [Acidobacteriaceae bacterium]